MLSLLLVAGLFACKHEDPAPEPGPLMVGVAELRMPVPVGIGTAGFGGFTVSAEPSPFANIYPATTQLHGHPTLQAIVVSRGPGFEAVFVRTDTVGIFQQLRRDVVLKLEDRLGQPMDDALIIGATHTHSGPGRVIDGGGIYDLIADTFLPEFYDGMVGGIVDVVDQAYADLKPGRVGHVIGELHVDHNDRRCEDGVDYENPALPMLAFEQEGELEALLATYAMHGTVLGIEDLTLSADAAGAFEEGVENGFDHPVQVMMMNSWGADMAPGEPQIAVQDGAVQPDGYDRFVRLGLAASDAVQDALPGVTWTDEPDIDVHVLRAPIDRQHIGYEMGEFPYDSGGVYCESSVNVDCDVTTTQDDLDEHCIGFPSDYPAPLQTEFSVGHIGDLRLVTFPGEPGTLLAEALLARVDAASGPAPTMFVGYAQDYIGYSILEDDWWQGGYEASGALWGPKQGQYLSDRVVEGWTAVYAEGVLPEQPAPTEPFGGSTYTPYAPTPPRGPGTVLVDALASYVVTDVITVTVAGSDPWLGTPVATLVNADGAPVLRPNGLPITSDGYSMWVDLAVDPSYRTVAPPDRQFAWTFHLPAGSAVQGGLVLSGSYKLSVALPTSDGSSSTVESAVFAVE